MDPNFQDGKKLEISQLVESEILLPMKSKKKKY